MSGCLYCESGCRWCQPEAFVFPDWFTATRTNRTQAEHVMKGRHPTGRPLHEVEALTCGTCVHVTRKHFSGTYIKCATWKDTGGPATDIRLRWRACEEWEVKDESD